MARKYKINAKIFGQITIYIASEKSQSVLFNFQQIADFYAYITFNIDNTAMFVVRTFSETFIYI